MGIRVYEVGGCVRDRLLGRVPKDIDYAVEAPSFEAMREFVESEGGKIYIEKPEYFTLRAKWRNVDADFVLCRKDGAYKDGRRPDSVSMGTIYDDLSRRDFTMNAIALDMNTQEYIDPFDGARDIHNKIIRSVRSAKDRFREDALRLIRAIRFSITLGFTFSLDVHLALSDNSLISLIEKVSVERIREELMKCFATNTLAALEVFHHYPLITEAIFDNNSIWLEPTIRKV